MKILNIHGYQGSATNSNYKILNSLGCKVISLQFDYDNESPQQVYDKLFDIVESNDIDLIVGTSFGAFFAKRLSMQFQIPCILTNPCLRPDISLFNLSPKYFNKFENITTITDWVLDEVPSTFENCYIIAGTEDEVIDHSITKEMVDGKINWVQGGHHSVDPTLYSNAILDGITFFTCRDAA